MIVRKYYGRCPKMTPVQLEELRAALDRAGMGTYVTYGRRGEVVSHCPVAAWARTRWGEERVLLVWIPDPQEGCEDERVLIIEEEEGK